MRNTFKVYERLKKEQHISTLFRNGKAFSVTPVRFIYIVGQRSEAGASPVQAGFSVPKKRFRHSVDRHRIKRQLTEAWRTNKQSLYAAVPANTQLHIFLIFTGKELPRYGEVVAAVATGIDRLAKQFSAV